MRGTGKKAGHQESGKSCFPKRNIGPKLNAALQIKNGSKISQTRKCKPKSKSHAKTIGAILSKRTTTDSPSKGSRSGSTTRKLIHKKTLHKAIDTESSKKESSSKLKGEKPPQISTNKNGETVDKNVKPQKLKKRGKRKRRKDNSELDEASRLQRRTRYLLIKMKLEQNLIDAYSGEGWKGHSREKIRPEKELQRATKQILKCKLGIRDAIRQLESLSSIGCIEDTAIASDGSVYHEHIICAKCKLREAFPDNDIILCDGTCNCAFHQKCLDPPLETENIPPGDQGWFCKFCECKMEILEAMNAHLGTRFSVDSTWQDIFKEEAALPDGGSALPYPEEDWPSDDSQDHDYDPERNENSCSISTAGTEGNASDDTNSSLSLSWSFEDEILSGSKRSGIISADSDETSDCEIISGRRQRRAVDYRKLYDEMFGKDAHANEQVSEDEDWGPANKRRREKESDAASTLITLYEGEKKLPNVETMEAKQKISSDPQTKRPFSRIPLDAVEKLRQAFGENELPSRDVRENLAKQLGLDYEKVNKWFKNARYIALKTRKAERAKQLQTSPRISKESRSEIVKDKTVDLVASRDNCKVLVNIEQQSPDIAQGVHGHLSKKPEEIGAGDQGHMFGYATDETPELMPLTHVLATKLGAKLTEVRKNKTCPWLRPDGKTQVTVEYRNEGGAMVPIRVHTVLISTQHDETVTNDQIAKELREHVIKPVIPSKFMDDKTIFHLNPSGRFVIGGPHGDAGLTGRKIIIDTYGGWGAGAKICIYSTISVRVTQDLYGTCSHF